MSVSVEDINQTVKQNKWLRNLEDDMKLIMPYIDNRDVTDIAIGHGGELIVEEIGKDKNFTGTFFDEATTTRIIYASAAVMGVTIDKRNPVAEGNIRLSNGVNIRFEGILPPRCSERPMIFLRRPSEKIFTLEDYVQQGRLSKDKFDLLMKHIEMQSNIVLSGATGSGKTSMLKAILEKMVQFTPNSRFYIVEDASEIQCSAKDVVPVFAQGEDTLDAVRQAMRCKVGRIIFGELRYGSTTNELLKAWNSGHRGGITTIHADSALLTIEKLRSLLREVILGELPVVAQSVQLIIHMIPTKNGPVVNEVMETHQAASSSFTKELESNHLI